MTSKNQSTATSSEWRGIPEWAQPGLILLTPEDKIPISSEVGYTTKCARRYRDQVEEPKPFPRARLNRIDRHLANGGNVGWVPPNGIAVIDCDNAAAVDLIRPYTSSETPTQTRHAASAHFYVSVDEETQKVYCRNGIKLDVGGDEPAILDVKTWGFAQPKKKGGGYVVIPPSTHADGRDYEWEVKLPADPSDIPQLDPKLWLMLNPFFNRAAAKEKSRGRHNQVLRYTLRTVIEADSDTPDSRKEIRGLVEKFVRDLYAGDENRMQEEIDDIDRQLDGAFAHEDAFAGFVRSGTDSQLADELDMFLGHTFVYVNEEKQWRRWNGEVWEPSASGSVRALIHDYAKELRADALVADDSDEQTRLWKLAGALEGTGKASLVHAAMQAKWSVSYSAFNRNKSLVTFPESEELGAEAVTLNLDTGEMYSPKPEDRITRKLGAPYVELAQHDVVDEFLATSFPDVETRECVMMLLAQSMLPWLPEEKFFFMHGKGASGKGTIGGAMCAALGDQAATAEPATFAGAGNRDASKNAPDLYALKDRSFVFCDEISSHQSIGTRMKNLCSHGTVTAAPKYGHQMEFPVTWSAWIAGNARPKIDANDSGLLRRIVEIPMDAGAADPATAPWEVKETIVHDSRAQAAWMWHLVSRLEELRESGWRVELSGEVERATQDWLDSADPFWDWFSSTVELTHRSEKSKVKASELLRSYELWMDEAHGPRTFREHPRGSQRQLAAFMAIRGVEKRKFTDGWFYMDVKLGSVEPEERGRVIMRSLPKPE